MNPFRSIQRRFLNRNSEEEFRGISLKKFGCSAARNCKRGQNKRI